jgi:hypothetical protein
MYELIYEWGLEKKCHSFLRDSGANIRKGISMLCIWNLNSENGLFREIIYAEEPNMAQKSDPIDWWHENEKKFPKLASIARQFLTSLATSVV